MFDFEYQLKILPDKPGVYLMKNSLGEVIYVGKAKVLKNRVRQYFQSSKNHSEKVKAMVKNIAEFEYIVTDSEMEALILECNLIKKYRPRYNILLKDDKHYPFIKVTTNEDFPRVFMTRIHAKDGAKYFGPYTDYGAVYETLDLIKKVFPLRTCKMSIKEGEVKSRPCLNYHIGLCSAPCAAMDTKENYGKTVQNIIDLLSGKDKNIVKDLRQQMEEAAINLEFEKAAAFRDKITAVEKIVEKQKIIIGNFEDEDFISIYSDEMDTCAMVFFLRDGKVVGREHYMLESTAGTEKGEIVSDFIKEFYSGTAFIPKNIYVPEAEDSELLEQWLTMRRESKVWIKVPQRGDKKDLLEMVTKNAKLTMEQFKTKLKQDKEIHRTALKELAEILELEELPTRIEAYDISNIQGVDSVGSMIVFEGGKAKNSDYRRFKIKSVIGANDYDSMREILTRRFKHGLEELEKIKERNLELSAGKFCVFPDLIMMDGGKGQVNIALEVLQSLNIDIPVCGMVKDDKHNTRGLIYNNNEVFMRSSSNAMHLITRVQDEVHRFAITYHRSLRDKRVLHSVLEDIPNVGERRRKALLQKFGSIEKIKNASFEELIETESIDKKAAQCIVDYFSKAKENN
ncbi:excinuclease ABC subunit UvrC [Clostridium swellfunianum]|uniref:excinuclease ABC subunit UvrC n=1 Tax=Clostridium swellfunianum TaxID=1367462 RepID=UPI002030DACD|nr:excinuclease ABC subunit UvrC [Clostridium swellfunianum]MCM0651053.1 excinuclease ABC subunit UvrC [Clostridium swellfunianum]